MSYDEFDHPGCFPRCTVEIDGETFTVSSSILGNISRYFRQAFHGATFTECQAHHVKVERSDADISANDFRSFLNRCYGGSDSVNAETYLSLLKCAEYFSCDSILEDVEDFIIASCSRKKLRANKRNPDKFFAIPIITGIELSFEYRLKNVKAHMLKMLGHRRFQTFLKECPDFMQLQDHIRLWIFDFYAKKMIAQAD